MKRSLFLKLGAGIPFLSWIPGHAKAGGAREPKGFKVDAGKDRFNKSLAPFDGDRFFCKVSTSDTDGDNYIFESTREKEGGPPLHFHYDQDEWWYILEGEFLVKIGEQTYHAKPGDFVFGPRKVPHTFAKVGTGLGRVIIGFQPAGKMEACFQKISAGVTANMSEAERDQFKKDHGFERVGPPLTHLKQ